MKNGLFSAFVGGITAAALVSALSPAPGSADAGADGYRLAGYGGHLAVYAAAGGAPREVTPIRLELLPGPDAEQLRRGVSVADEAELAALLEDFSL